jgi:hypothetical protein
MIDAATTVGEVRTEEQEQGTMAPQAATKAKANKPAKKKAQAKKKAKKPAKKPAKAKAKKPTKKSKKKPTTGQSGPPVDVPFDTLNDKERKVVTFLNGKGKGPRNPLKIAEIAGACWPRMAKAQANSWTRNSLRRLVCGGWVEKKDGARGLYWITEKGRKRLQRA